MGRTRVGISGWRYEPWRGVFYPRGLAQHRELEYASRRLPTIEIRHESFRAPAPPPRKSRDVYCYFDNDMKVHAPFDARGLIDRLEKDGPRRVPAPDRLPAAARA